MTLWHETDGQGEQALVLIHGWGMNAAVWEPLLPQLHEHYRVTRVDLPGHGESEMLTDTLTGWAAAVAAVVPDQAVWAGWSLGGLVALQAALNKVSMAGLYMITATPCFTQRENWQPAMPRKTLQQFADSLSQDVQGTLTRFLSLQVSGCDNARDLLKQLKRGFARRPQAGDEALKAGLRMLQEMDLRHRLGELQLPVEWLLGGRDTLVPGRLATALPELNPALEIETLADAGHVPFYSHTGSWLAPLSRLCDRLQETA